MLTLLVDPHFGAFLCVVCGEPRSQKVAGRGDVLKVSSGLLDGAEDLADGSSVFRAPLGVRQDDDSLSVENEIAPELTSVLTAMEVGYPPPQQGLPVEEDDIRMRVRS